MDDSKSRQPKKAPEDQEEPAVPESDKDVKDQEEGVAAESGESAKEAKPAAPESEKTESGGGTERKPELLDLPQISPYRTGEVSQPSPLTSDTTSGIGMGSGSATPSHALSGTETGSDPNIRSSAADTSASAETSGEFTPKVKTKGKSWKDYLFPNKKNSDFSVPKEKPKSRFSLPRIRGSRSLPPEKSLKVAAESESIPPAEGACAKSNDKDSTGKTDKGACAKSNDKESTKTDKGSFSFSKVKRWAGKLLKRSNSESDSLVTNAEGSKTDTKLADKKSTEKIVEADDESTEIRYWTAGRDTPDSEKSPCSLYSQPTAATDLPSTAVIVTEGVKSSEGSENASQEAVPGSLASSSSEISRAETDKEHSDSEDKNSQPDT